jgi:outer membrane lipoprotein-sorting protein
LRNRLLRFAIILLFGSAVATAGCVSRTHKVSKSERPKPAQTTTFEEVVQKFNRQVEAFRSFQAKVRFDLRSGSLQSGELKDYHEIKGFVLLRRPDHLRMIGQIPTFGVNALDMVSDGRQFRVAFAPYKKFVVGSATDRPHSAKPLENLRPWHILEVLNPAVIAPSNDARLVFREEVSEGRDNFYVLYEVDRAASGDALLHRKLWIDRSDFHLSRQQLYSTDGVLESDAHYAEYADWAGISFPKTVSFFRPPEDYGLNLVIDDIRFNLTLDDDKFTLEKPQGYEVIEIGKKPIPSSGD